MGHFTSQLMIELATEEKNDGFSAKLRLQRRSH